MSLGKVLLVGGLVYGTLLTVGALIGKFFRSGDDDSTSPGLPQPYSDASRERRPLQDHPPRYQSYSDPHAHVASSHQQSPPVSTRQRLSRDFLPIYDRHDYETARAEARRLVRHEEKYLVMKERAERRGDVYHTSHYEQLIKSQRQIIDVLNAEASKWIYQENNHPGSLPANSVDLHGLKVVEAIEYAKMAVQDAEVQGKHKVRLIVGKGRHSEGGVSKLKPAIKNAFKSQRWDVEVDPRNAGVLVVWLKDIQLDMA